MTINEFKQQNDFLAISGFDTHFRSKLRRNYYTNKRGQPARNNYCWRAFKRYQHDLQSLY